MSIKKSFIHTFLHVLSIGLALQFHYSWIILGMISLFLLYRRVIKVNWIAFALSLGTIAISLIPYFQEYMVNDKIRTNQGAKDGEHYIGWGGVHVYPVLKAILYWLRYASYLFTNRLILGVDFSWISSYDTIHIIFQYLFRAVVFVVGVTSIYISIVANLYFYKKVKERYSKKLKDEPWLITYLSGVVIALIISAILSPIVFNYWHLLIVFPFALFVVLYWVDNIDENKKRVVFKFLPALLIYFIIVNSFIAISSKKYSYKNDYSKQVIEVIKSHKIID